MTKQRAVAILSRHDLTFAEVVVEFGGVKRVRSIALNSIKFAVFPNRSNNSSKFKRSVGTPISLFGSGIDM